MKNDDTKNNNIIKKPAAGIYYPLAGIARLWTGIAFHTKYDLKDLKKIKGPAVIMCSHTSNLDFILVAAGLLPLRPTYIMSSHFFSHPKIGKLLAPLHAIPKKMFCADINAVRQIMKAKKSGNVIIMFPEGRLSCYGHTLQIADGTAELIKKLGVDVYWMTGHGIYKALPKWGHAGIRKGPIRLEGGKLFSGDELGTLSIREIENALADAIRHDDETAFPDHKYRCRKPAPGLERILYKCPVCGEEFKMSADDTTLTCTACGATWELDEYYKLHGSRFDSINKWFEWEHNEIDLDAGLECDCILSTPDETGVTNRSAGSGHISIDREKICFTGTCFGEPLEFTEKTSVIKAFPATVGDHFDIYSNKIMYNIIPQPDPATCIKWVQYLDKLNEK